ncbi:MAG: hypothetical protein ACI4E0_13990 [Blautia sp.]
MNIMDVTLRESVYYGKGLRNQDALEYLRMLKKNIPNKWVQFVEIGYINNDKVVPLNYDEEYFNRAIDICGDTYKVTAMMHVPKADIEKWNPEVIRRLDLVRVVVGQHVPDELKKYVDYMHGLGVKISVNLTYVVGLSDEKIISEMNRASAMGVDYFFCADSSGSFSPASTARISKLLLKNCGDMITGIHLHDHMQMSTANALTAKDCGVAMTDVSVTGAGKGGGNLKMEQGLLLLCGKEAVSFELLQGLNNMIVYFAGLIGRDAKFYSQELVEFLTGLYRLSLKATTELEEKSAMNPETYFQMITEKYRPFDVE